MSDQAHEQAVRLLMQAIQLLRTDVGTDSASADPLLDVSEAAAYLSTGVSYVRRLVLEKRVEYVKVGGYHVRIRQSALDELLQRPTPAKKRSRPAVKAVAEPKPCAKCGNPVQPKYPGLARPHRLCRECRGLGQKADSTIDCEFCLGVTDHVPACPVWIKINKHTGP